MSLECALATDFKDDSDLLIALVQQGPKGTITSLCTAESLPKCRLWLVHFFTDSERLRS